MIFLVTVIVIVSDIILFSLTDILVTVIVTENHIDFWTSAIFRLKRKTNAEFQHQNA